MLFNSKQMSINALLLVAVSLSTWLVLINHFKPAYHLILPNQHPDAFAEQVLLTRMDVNGAPENRLATTKLIYYQTRKITALLAPEVLLYAAGKAPWQVTAEHAEAQQDAKVIQLWGNVRAQQAGHNQQPPLTFTTPALTVYPQKQLAQTTQQVTLSQPNSFIRAIGLTANMQTGDIKLIASTIGHYLAVKT